MTTPTPPGQVPDALPAIQRFEVVDCIDSKHVPAVIPKPHGPWVRYEDHAAPPTAQAEGWRDIATAPKDGVFLVYMQDEVRPARRMQVADWHSNVKIVGGLFSFDCATVTHWMPLPLPPTSAEGVEP